MSKEIRQNATLAVQLMHDYRESLGMPQIKDKITFYLYYDLDALVAAFARVKGISIDQARDEWFGHGRASEGWVFVHASAQWMRQNPLGYIGTSAGELCASQNYALSRLPLSSAHGQVPEAGPRWLDAGICSFLEAQAFAAGGLLSYDTERNSIDPWGYVQHAKYVDKSLKELEIWTGFVESRGGPYDYSQMAVELLASYAGQNSLIHYYTLTQPGTTWQEAFQAVFGMTVEEFYELFEEHRAAGFPEVELPK